MAARGSKDERILAELLAEAERIRQAIARDRREQEARLADAAEALSRGKEVDGLTALLLRAKAANAEREAKPAPAPKRIESKADFIVDSSGITEAAPAPSVESTPPTPAPLLPAESAPPPAPKAPPFRIEPEPTPPPRMPQSVAITFPQIAYVQPRKSTRRPFEARLKSANIAGDSGP